MTLYRSASVFGRSSQGSSPGEEELGYRPPASFQSFAQAPAGSSNESLDGTVVRLLALDLLLTVALQRIYVGTSITLATHLAILVLLIHKGIAYISTARFVLCLMFLGCAGASMILSGNPFSFTSYLLAIVCYLPFILVIPSSQNTYYSVLGIYQLCALAISGLVLLQMGMQVLGLPMLHMDWFVPSGLVAPTMNYIQNTAWKTGTIKPNGFFMLEASFACQFIGMAFVIELAVFRRVLFAGTFLLAALTTFSGTGIILVAASMPFLLGRHWKKMLWIAVISLPMLAGLAVATGWYEANVNRFMAYDARQSSMAQRFVLPYVNMLDVIKSGDIHTLLFGYGAGETSDIKSTKIDFADYSAMSKVFLDYGIITFLTFLLFFTYCFCYTGVPFVISWAVLVDYHILGGYFTIPPILNYCFIVAAGWRIPCVGPIETKWGFRKSGSQELPSTVHSPSSAHGPLAAPDY